MELRKGSIIPDQPEADQTLNETVDTTEAVTETPVENESKTVTKESLLQSLSDIAELEAENIAADKVALIKQQFYMIHNEEIKAAKEAFVGAGNAPEAFVAQADPDEEKLKEILNAIKAKKGQLRERQEAEQQRNYERKLEIIKELDIVSNDTDNVNRHYPKVKELQTEFKSTGEVPPQHAAAVWKAYQEAVERFYDQWKVNKELRDYDFKKNLSEKQLLVDEAQKLVEEKDVITAFKRLQELHEKWREIGPVAKELREEIWSQFKDASAVINKRYQAFFEERKNRERENEMAKTALCERLEALDLNAPASFAAWDDMTKQILQAQEDWKKLGFASKKANNALFARFRAICDDFFARKAAFFKQMKDTHAENLAKKTALCEQAEALKDSTDWKQTTDKLIALQKEWKTIGTVAKKHSDVIWNRFLAACDYFFEQKKKNASGTRKTEQSNLAIKQDIIAQLKALNSADDKTPRNEAIKQLHELRNKWQNTGHVPFKEKDKLHETYRVVVGELFDKLDIHENKAKISSFESSINEMEGDENKLYRERERLLRAYENRRNELHTYENNLGFFNSRSKNGDSMLREMQRKMQRIKEDLSQLEKKIEIIDSKLS